MKAIFLFAGLLVFPLRAFDAPQPILSISVYVTPYAPHFIKKENGSWHGIQVEMAKALIEKAGFTAEFQELPWTRGVEYFKAGTLDMLTMLSRTPEREAFAYYIGIAVEFQQVLVVKQENAKLVFPSINELAVGDFVWGIQENTFLSKEFQVRYSSDNSFHEHFSTVSTSNLNIKKLIGDRITGYFSDRISAEYRIKFSHEEEFGDYKKLAIISLPFMPADPVYFAVNKHVDKWKVEKLQKAYDTLKAQGVFGHIISKWTKP